MASSCGGGGWRGRGKSKLPEGFMEVQGQGEAGRGKVDEGRGV